MLFTGAMFIAHFMNFGLKIGVSGRIKIVMSSKIARQNK
jgi:hypothetical protein